MNTIIKLPAKAISNIIENKKELLVLKFFPANFNHKKDTLLVEDEETGIVHCVLRIDSVYWNNNISKILLKFYKQLAYVKGNILSYFNRKKGFYVFHIYSVTIFK